MLLQPIDRSRVLHTTGAEAIASVSPIQAVWKGYGEVVRVVLQGGPVPSVVVKRITPGRGAGRSHRRKLASYAVEHRWYRDHAGQCGPGCRVPRVWGTVELPDGWLFVLEDLDASGYARRVRSPGRDDLGAALAWLAHFHAVFLGAAADGLWSTGTYWHLATRPEEWATMPQGDLRRAASAIDARLSGARFQTLVHGDAKPANFCFREDGGEVAAVDFQYVGAGPGVKDVVYLLAGEPRPTVSRGLDTYFNLLANALPADLGPAVVQEWRSLVPWASADFQRFLAGWAPGWRVLPHELQWTRRVLQSI